MTRTGHIWNGQQWKDDKNAARRRMTGKIARQDIADSGFRRDMQQKYDRLQHAFDHVVQQFQPLPSCIQTISVKKDNGKLIMLIRTNMLVLSEKIDSAVFREDVSENLTSNAAVLRRKISRLYNDQIAYDEKWPAQISTGNDLKLALKTFMNPKYYNKKNDFRLPSVGRWSDKLGRTVRPSDERATCRQYLDFGFIVADNNVDLMTAEQVIELTKFWLTVLTSQLKKYREYRREQERKSEISRRARKIEREALKSTHAVKPVQDFLDDDDDEDFDFNDSEDNDFYNSDDPLGSMKW